MMLVRKVSFVNYKIGLSSERHPKFLTPYHMRGKNRQVRGIGLYGTYCTLWNILYALASLFFPSAADGWGAVAASV